MAGPTLSDAGRRALVATAMSSLVTARATVTTMGFLQAGQPDQEALVRHVRQSLVRELAREMTRRISTRVSLGPGLTETHELRAYVLTEDELYTLLADVEAYARAEAGR